MEHNVSRETFKRVNYMKNKLNYWINFKADNADMVRWNFKTAYDWFLFTNKETFKHFNIA